MEQFLYKKNANNYLIFLFLSLCSSFPIPDLIDFYIYFHSLNMLALLLTLFFLQCISSSYSKIVHSTDPTAKCLDGSTPALYLHKGSSNNKILIFLFGGGFCQGTSLSNTIQSCYQRSKTDKGSSLPLPETFQGQGYLSTDVQISPFAQWTKVLIPSCDGAFHQGNRTNPISYKATNLYFRGHQIMKSHIEYLIKNANFSEAEEVVLTGVQAGAVGSSLWANYIESKLGQNGQIKIILDSGLFLDYPSFKNGDHQFESELANIYKIANVDSPSPNELCNNHYGTENWKCFLLFLTYSYLFDKKLFINSEYDNWAIQNILQISCLKKEASGNYNLDNCSTAERNAIEEYRRAYQLKIFQIVQRNKNSLWSISCSSSSFSNSLLYNSQIQRIPPSTGITVKEAIEKFISNEQVVAVDHLVWPDNQPCSEF